jgi:hypothetical protein
MYVMDGLTCRAKESCILQAAPTCWGKPKAAGQKPLAENVTGNSYRLPGPCFEWPVTNKIIVFEKYQWQHITIIMNRLQE